MIISKTTQKSTIAKLLILTIAFTLALSINYIFAAWTGPTQAPPQGNTPTPIHVGTTAQVKDGGLSLNSLAVFGNGFFQGKITVGDSGNTPVAGTIRWSGSDFEGYDGTKWVSLTSGETTIVSSDAVDCTNTGGNWVDSQSVCYFPTTTCSSGWIPKENYSSTEGTSAGFSQEQSACEPPKCSTGDHFRQNIGTESCTYKHKVYNSCEVRSITATQTEIGCTKN